MIFLAHFGTEPVISAFLHSSCYKIPKFSLHIMIEIIICLSKKNFAYNFTGVLSCKSHIPHFFPIWNTVASLLKFFLIFETHRKCLCHKSCILNLLEHHKNNALREIQFFLLCKSLTGFISNGIPQQLIWQFHFPLKAHVSSDICYSANTR